MIKWLSDGYWMGMIWPVEIFLIYVVCILTFIVIGEKIIEMRNKKEDEEFNKKYGNKTLLP